MLKTPQAKGTHLALSIKIEIVGSPNLDLSLLPGILYKFNGLLDLLFGIAPISHLGPLLRDASVEVLDIAGHYLDALLLP